MLLLRKTLTGLASLVAAALGIATVNAAHGTTLLAIDFGGNTTQPGFIAQANTVLPYSLPGGMSVFVEAWVGPDVFDHNLPGALPSTGSSVVANGADINPLLDDGLISGAGESLVLSINGAVGTFGVEIWVYDGTGILDDVIMRQNIILHGTGIVAVPDAGLGRTTAPSAFSFTSDGSLVTIEIAPEDGINLRVNGFAITQSAVDVPAALPLMAAGIGGLALLARRRK